MWTGAGGMAAVPVAAVSTGDALPLSPSHGRQATAAVPAGADCGAVVRPGEPHGDGEEKAEVGPFQLRRRR